MPMPEIVGKSLTDATFNTNVSVAINPPASVTVSVIVVLPNWLSAGVIVAVRFAPLPPKTMLALGTRVVFDDVAATTRVPAAVCASPTINGMAPVATSSLVTWSSTLLIDGGVLAGSSLSTIVSTAVVTVPSNPLASPSTSIKYC